MNTLLILIVIFGYVLLQAIEMASIGSRVAGRLAGRLALGTTLQQSIYTASRFLLVIFLPALAFLVESGIQLDDYVIIVIISLMMAFLMALLILIKLNFIQHYFLKVFLHYDGGQIPSALFKSFYSKNYFKNSFKEINFYTFSELNTRKTFAAFSAYLFLANGFFVSFLLAIKFPEYRLTLSQFTAAFHGVGALIVAFYLDPMLSRSMDNNVLDEVWKQNVYSILYGRVISYLFVSLIFLMYFVL